MGEPGTASICTVGPPRQGKEVTTGTPADVLSGWHYEFLKDLEPFWYTERTAFWTIRCDIWVFN